MKSIEHLKTKKMTFKERLEQQYAKESEFASNDNDPEVTGFDSEYFGIDNIKSYPACLDLRLQDGKRLAIPYSNIQELSFDPEGIVEITTTNKVVEVRGRELEKLFDYLTAYRVRYILMHNGTDTSEEGLFVKEIAINEKY